MSDLFFIFIFIFITINRIIFLVVLLEYVQLILDHNVDEECEQFLNRKSSALGCCLAFAYFFANINLALLIKVFLV